MAQSPDWQQFLEVGMHFTAMTRAEAHRRARELVREGQLAQERVQAFVDELLDTSRRRADEFVEAVRHEVERQLKLLGVASRLPGRRPAGPVKAAKTATKRGPTTKPTKATKAAKKSAKSGKNSGKNSGKKAAKTKGAKKPAKKAKHAATASGTATTKAAATKATTAARTSAAAATKQSP